MSYPENESFIYELYNLLSDLKGNLHNNCSVPLLERSRLHSVSDGVHTALRSDRNTTLSVHFFMNKKQLKIKTITKSNSDQTSTEGARKFIHVLMRRRKKYTVY